jgi:outer membrane protein assembly factor BamE (lipoprotein component of BamABCDE complex)
MKGKIILLLGVTFTLISCAPQTSTNPQGEQNLTLGLVQKSIKIGMSQSEVAEALGSPNIVTTDAEGNETWVYDKIATNVKTTNNNSFVFLIFLGGSKNSIEKDQSQKTLTVLVKFDKDKKVKDVKYHVTNF